MSNLHGPNWVILQSWRIWLAFRSGFDTKAVALETSQRIVVLTSCSAQKTMVLVLRRLAAGDGLTSSSSWRHSCSIKSFRNCLFPVFSSEFLFVGATGVHNAHSSAAPAFQSASCYLERDDIKSQ